MNHPNLNKLLSEKVENGVKRHTAYVVRAVRLTDDAKFKEGSDWVGFIQSGSPAIHEKKLIDPAEITHMGEMQFGDDKRWVNAKLVLARISSAETFPILQSAALTFQMNPV